MIEVDTLRNLCELARDYPEVKYLSLIDDRGSICVEFFEAPEDVAQSAQHPQSSAPVAAPRRTPRDVLREYRNPPRAANGDDDAEGEG